MTVTDSQIDVLVKMLDVAVVRQRTIAQNVANVNTPGYHRLDVQFEEALTSELAHGGQATANSIIPKIVAHLGDERADGNNVDIDQEMARLNKNATFYSTYMQILSHKFALMRSAITGH
jgi:flagellar basal-body rod protein FlgB